MEDIKFEDIKFEKDLIHEVEPVIKKDSERFTNSKNQLQEFCQKYRLGLPKYTTKKITDRKVPNFQTTVTLTWDKTYTTTGDIKNNKKSAEKSSAENMLNIIKSIKEQRIKHFMIRSNSQISDNIKIFIYIDMENIHIGDYFEYHHFDENFNFIGVATSNHSSLNNQNELYKVKILSINSDHKDAADTLMIYDIGNSIRIHGKSIYIIVTKDHFAAPLVEIINSQLGYGSKGYRCKTLDELEQILDQILDQNISNI
jgi:hypothetical protein